MSTDKQKVLDYINKHDSPVRSRLLELRDLILDVIPESIENISYGMPSYRIQAGKRPFVYLGVAKEHIGVYALHESLTPELQKELKKHITGRGTLQFRNNEPMPMNLIRKLLNEKRSQLNIK